MQHGRHDEYAGRANATTNIELHEHSPNLPQLRVHGTRTKGQGKQGRKGGKPLASDQTKPL